MWEFGLSFTGWEVGGCRAEEGDEPDGVGTLWKRWIDWELDG